jgi:hypothetical protein
MTKRNKPLRSQGMALQFATPHRFSELDEQPLYRHMFQEDIQSIRFSARLRGTDERTFRFEGTEEECAKANSLCAAIAHDDHYRTAENIAGAIGSVLQELCFYGRSMFEITEDQENSEYSFSSLSPNYVWGLFSYYLQIAPRGAWPYLDREYALLNKASIWQVEMPRELGGVRGFRRILKELSAWSSFGPGFVQEDLKKQQMPNEFIFTEYRRAHQVSLYRATKMWGWDCRDRSTNYLTEFYEFHRHFTFKWAQALLRDHIIRELNSLVSRLGINAQIVVEGLSSPEDILKVREQMHAGLLDFAGATKAVS